ncbi:DUF5339 domain-containing protein [Actinobacillus porcinus]|uniref:DUF5339 domain-containing protein n=1 Tax=Actinobacillus porcinus TaxID=51048 RepID=UPI0023F17B21|nr:DUF5339 domain-containing protein [Actinobacillus porcinus]MDD7545152.1 DUF5339 domain-containing protein [Actinobacillus porcinus]MDY5848413.1 DUF5339 domain-containing protein [Actinobacillus porcinus]
MKKYVIFLTALFSGLLFIHSNTQAAEQKVDEKLPLQCQKLFSETDKLITEAKNQPGTHTQINKIQSKLNQSKKQILEMELATQIKSCDHGLAKLTHLNKGQEETN